MEIFFYHIAIAITAFVVTNIDDLMRLSIYFFRPTYKKRDIIIGEYLGVSLLMLISLSGLILGQVIDTYWIKWLGLFPIFLGIKDIFLLYKNKGIDVSEAPKIENKKSKLWGIALVTFANGGNNLGVYTPLFATTKIQYVSLYVVIFLVLIGVWCLVAYNIGKNEFIKKHISKFGHIILPIFLIFLGISILK